MAKPVTSYDDAFELIARIYDAAFDPALWPATLVKIADAIGCQQIMMGVHDPAASAAAIIAPRMAPEFLQSYRSHWGRGDILWERTNRAPIGRVLVAERFVPRDEFLCSELYNEWQRPQGIGVAGLGVNLPSGGSIPAVFGAKRSSRNDEFDSSEIALFGLLAPHLVRAAQTQRRLWALRLREELALAHLNTQRHGVILLDAAARILFANSVAGSLVESKDGLRLDAARLSATHRSAVGPLARLVSSCADGRSAHGPAGGSLLIVRDTARAPLRVTIVPFRTATPHTDVAWLGLARPVAVVMIAVPELENCERKENLRQRFGLTAAEADFALEIVKGDGRQAAAARLGITLATARTHLERIFEKTGVHRQAELVRVLLEDEGSVGEP